MKKIKLLLILPFVFAFVLLANRSFAQIPQGITENPLFDMTKTVTTDFISVSNKQPQEINILPFSKAIINPQSFADNVNVYVFQGKWEKIKALLPTNQSPISSYYLIFVDSKGKQVTPTNEITIQSYNNYVGTDTFFYPIGAVGNVDSPNAKKWPGHIVVNTLLPIQDSAFVVSANKILDKNDPSLNPAANPPTSQNKTNINNPPGQKYFVLGLLVAATLLLSFMMWGNKKNRRKKR